jgi:glycyl-tRNA synthetase
LEAYTEIEGGRTTTTESTKDLEIMLKLPYELAPIKVAVLPLSKKEPLLVEAQAIARNLSSHFTLQYDETSSIGRRYRRQDEIGTPYCVTVDFETANDKSVTVRDRDTMQQERIKIDGLLAYFKEKFIHV